jgi:hypothetical protein
VHNGSIGDEILKHLNQAHFLTRLSLEPNLSAQNFMTMMIGLDFFSFATHSITLLPVILEW